MGIHSSDPMLLTLKKIKSISQEGQDNVMLRAQTMDPDYWVEILGFAACWIWTNGQVILPLLVSVSLHVKWKRKLNKFIYIKHLERCLSRVSK